MDKERNRMVAIRSGKGGAARDSRLVDPLYPFGFGLSYTTFEYKNLKIENNLTTRSGDLKVSFDLTNVGNMAGDEIPQLYIEDVRSSVITYQYQLRGFDRIFLKSGKTKRVVFTLKPEHLTLLNREMDEVVEPGLFKLTVGVSSTDIRLNGEFEIIK